MTAVAETISIQTKLQEKQQPFVLRWRHAVLGENGPAKSITRLVLLVLTDHMDDDGFAYPGINRIATNASISARAAAIHLALAAKDGWIERRSHGDPRRDRRTWKRYCYQARIPPPRVRNVVPDLPRKGGEPGSIPSQEGAERGDKKVRNDVPTNSLLNSLTDDTTALPRVPKRKNRKTSTKRPTASPDPEIQSVAQHIHEILKSNGNPSGIVRWDIAIRNLRACVRDGHSSADLRAAATWGINQRFWRGRLLGSGATVMRQLVGEWKGQGTMSNGDRSAGKLRAADALYRTAREIDDAE